MDGTSETDVFAAKMGLSPSECLVASGPHFW
jgi:hypothetical protein